MMERDVCPILSVVDRGRLKSAQQWDVGLLGISLDVQSGEVEQDLDTMLNTVEKCSMDMEAVFGGELHSGSAACIFLSSSWLYITNPSKKLLYSRHEVQDISSVGYVKDDGMFVLLLKCWQAPGLRFLALAINCRKKSIVSAIIKELRQKFADMCMSDNTGRYSRHSMIIGTLPRKSSIDSSCSPSSAAAVSHSPSLGSTPAPSVEEAIPEQAQLASTEQSSVESSSLNGRLNSIGSGPGSPAKGSASPPREGNAKDKSRMKGKTGLRWLVKSAFRRSSDTDVPKTSSLPRSMKKNRRMTRGKSVDISTPLPLYMPENVENGTLRYIPADENDGPVAAGSAAETNSCSEAGTSHDEVTESKVRRTPNTLVIAHEVDDAVFSAEPVFLTSSAKSQAIKNIQLSKASSYLAPPPMQKRSRSIDALNHCGEIEDETLRRKARRKARRRTSLPPPPSPPRTPPLPPKPAGFPITPPGVSAASPTAPPPTIEPLYASIRKRSASLGCILMTPSPEPPMLPARSLNANVFISPERQYAVLLTAEECAEHYRNHNEEVAVQGRVASPSCRPPMPVPCHGDDPSPPPSVKAFRDGIAPSRIKPEVSDGDAAPRGSSKTKVRKISQPMTGHYPESSDSPWFLVSSDEEDETSSATQYSEVGNFSDNTIGRVTSEPWRTHHHRPSWYNYSRAKATKPKAPPATLIRSPLSQPSPDHDNLQHPSQIHSSPSSTNSASVTRPNMHKKLVKRVSSSASRRRTSKAKLSSLSANRDRKAPITVEDIVTQVMSSRIGQEQLRHAVGQVLTHTSTNGALNSHV